MSWFPWFLYAFCFLSGFEPRGAAAVAQEAAVATAQEVPEGASGQGRPSSAAPQGELKNARDELERASLSLDGETIDSAAATLARVCAATPNDGWAHYYAAQAGYLGMLRALREPALKKDATHFTRARDAAVKHGKEALELLAKKSEPAALLAVIHGVEIGRDPLLGMTLGPKSDDLCDRAIEADEQNPRAWIVRGTSLLFKPAFVGGSPEKACEAFRRAAELADAEAQRTDVASDPLAPRWGRAEAHCWLGQALVATGDLDGARKAYEKALAIEPEYGWVKHELLPGLEKKIAAKGER